MRCSKKIFKIISIFLITMILISSTTFAKLLEKKEYSEDFKRYLQLSDEEKKKVIMPRVFDIEEIHRKPENPLYKVKMLKAAMDMEYSLMDYIPDNLIIKDQEETHGCWTFATLSSLETNLALLDYKNNNPLKIYDFSERHMNYSMSRSFTEGINEYGYNRKVSDGGNWYFADTYLTNGFGAIPEEEMPYENNEDLISINQIQGKTISSEIFDTIEFPDYSSFNEDEKKAIMDEIKNHIQNFGSVFAVICGKMRVYIQ